MSKKKNESKKVDIYLKGIDPKLWARIEKATEHVTALKGKMAKTVYVLESGLDLLEQDIKPVKIL